MAFSPDLLAINDLHFIEIGHPLQHDRNHFLAFSFDIHIRGLFISSTILALVDDCIFHLNQLLLFLVSLRTLATNGLLGNLRVEVKSTETALSRNKESRLTW